MTKVKIFTDSAADLPVDLLTRYDIGVVPLLVSHGNDIYADGVDLTHDQFFHLLETSDQLPTTSQPSPQKFIDAFAPYLQQGVSIISINLSSGLSGTVESALLAQASLGSLAEGRLHIVDSLAASVGQGLLVCLAGELAQQGKEAADIVAAVTEARRHLVHLFTLDTMENLVKGGRISRTKAILGEVLNIKPILRIDEQGKIEPLDKVRGRKKALRYLLDKCLTEAKQKGACRFGISHANCWQEAQALAQAIQEAIPGQDVIIGQIGAAIGTHTGSGCMAVFYYT